MTAPDKEEIDVTAKKEQETQVEDNEPVSAASVDAATLAAKAKSITIDTVVKDDEAATVENEENKSASNASQARTPKHANKTKEGEDEKDMVTDTEVKQEEHAAAAANKDADAAYPPAPRPYDGRPLGGGGGGAFQPTEAAARRQQQQQQQQQFQHHHHHHAPHQQPPPPDQYYTRSPMQISPGDGRYYDRRGMPAGYPPHSGLPLPPPPPPGYYEQQRGGYPGDYGPPPSLRSFDGGVLPPHHPHYHQQLHHHQYGGGGPPPYGGGSYGEVGYQGDPRFHGHGGGGGPTGPLPPSHFAGHYGPPPLHPSEQHYPRDAYAIDHGAGGPGVSRAVSSSFDRSAGSVREKPAQAMANNNNKAAGRVPGGATIDKAVGGGGGEGGDASVASDDDSWKQLKQVHSIDDTAIQEHLILKKKAATEKALAEDGDDERHPPSNSSSLTNSPTEGPERRAKAAEALLAAAATAASKQQVQQLPSSSLDELSSVASAQAPMDTGVAGDKKEKSNAGSTGIPASPATHDSESLDLMKCSSSSSNLLMSHQRTASEGLLFEGGNSKRSREEERGDKASISAEDELRRAASGTEEQPPGKKAKVVSSEKGGEGTLPTSKTPELKANNNAKASPMSIRCSPSASKRVSNMQQAKQSFLSKASPHSGENSFYDRPPAFSYSMDSAPPLPGGRKQPPQMPGNPVLPPRPGSSSSSSLPPGQMQDPSNDVVTSIPSWEIHAQDSFGAASVGGGHGLANNFSFQDYMISASESNLGAVAPNSEKTDGIALRPSGAQQHTTTTSAASKLPPPLSQTKGARPPPHSSFHHPHSHAPIESRNQSFEGGYYHGGSFDRSHGMDMGHHGRTIPGRPMLADPGFKHGHTGPFPPHAPSWGTAGSGGSHPSYQGHPHPGAHPYTRMGESYPIMRNYSHDSGHRASPPPGPPGGPRHYMHQVPAGFQPPPEFAAPHNPMGRRPPPAVYIMSSQGAHQPAKRGTGVFSWTKDDDMRLTEVMKKYKNPRDWEPIAKEHGMGKSAKECHERWIRYLKPGVRKGQWTDQEDAIVIEAVQTSAEQPFTRWSDLAQRLPGRVGKQIRDRWVNHLNPNINHLPFSREDDLLLWDGHKTMGKRWVEISTKLFNSTRSENHIKNRWYSASFKKFISNEFGNSAYQKTGKEEGKPTKTKKKTMAKDDDPATHSVVGV